MARKGAPVEPSRVGARAMKLKTFAVIYAFCVGILAVFAALLFAAFHASAYLR